MEFAKCGELIRQPLYAFLRVLQGENIVHTISNNGEIYDVGSSHPGGGENISSLPIGNNGVIKQAQNGGGLYKIFIFVCAIRTSQV